MVTLRSHKFILSASFARLLHPKVLYDLGKIGFDHQLKFQETYLAQRKHILPAYICLAFFPGTHYAFLGRWTTQILFWLTLGGGFVWWIIDFFRLKQMVRERNESTQRRILMDITSVNVFQTAEPVKKREMIPA